MAKKIAGIFLFLFLMTATSLYAQNKPVRSTEPLSKWERRFGKIRVGDRIYQTGSNWLTAGFGFGYSTSLDENHLNMAIAYHFRYKPVYFKIGYHYTDETFFLNNRLNNITFHNDFVGGIGIRHELNHFNFAFFISPTLAYGSVARPDEPHVADKYLALGVIPEVQLTYKFFYDVGIGTSLYGSFNKYHQCVGMRFHIYFSGAYRGEY
ncbi:MAG: hypothetical protein ACOCVX_02240 [Bacteroidales bacterium]|jgi:hypothetical protein